jgi:hypothetical protein
VLSQQGSENWDAIELMCSLGPRYPSVHVALMPGLAVAVLHRKVSTIAAWGVAWAGSLWWVTLALVITAECTVHAGGQVTEATCPVMNTDWLCGRSLHVGAVWMDRGSAWASCCGYELHAGKEHAVCIMRPGDVNQ